MSCHDTTTNRDTVCDMCRAEEVQFIADEIEAMLQHDSREYSEVKTEGNRVIVVVFEVQP